MHWPDEKNIHDEKSRCWWRYVYPQINLQRERERERKRVRAAGKFLLQILMLSMDLLLLGEQSKIGQLALWKSFHLKIIEKKKLLGVEPTWVEILISNLTEINDDRELRQEEEKSSKNTNAVLEKQKALVIWNTAKESM